MPIAKGTFEVKMNAEPPYFEADGVTLARATFDKTFHGPLSATSHVQFLSVRANEYAAYVALERIEGSLDGKPGSFIATHRAFAAPGDRSLEITIVPGAATGALSGLTGKMLVEVVDGKHSYTLDYDLPPKS